MEFNCQKINTPDNPGASKMKFQLPHENPGEWNRIEHVFAPRDVSRGVKELGDSLRFVNETVVSIGVVETGMNFSRDAFHFSPGISQGKFLG